MMITIAYGWEIWLGFSIFLAIALGIDTFVLNKSQNGPHQSMRVALIWTLIWVVCAFIFNAFLWAYLYATTTSVIASEVALDFLTGYLIEKSLSVDNLFAFYMIFHQFKVPPPHQQRVFSYGIWSAILLRLVLILLGAWLIEHFQWLLYLMGGVLVLTGIKMGLTRAHVKDLYTSKTFRFLQRHLRITTEFHGQRFFVKKNLLTYATPLFIALIFIEVTDVVFALDSIPAIFAITTDPFIVWTSNIFAILGLRAMYFLLAGVVNQFGLLKYAIAVILVFVGAKMLMAPWWHVPVELSLLIIFVVLVLFGGISYVRRPRLG